MELKAIVVPSEMRAKLMPHLTYLQATDKYSDTFKELPKKAPTSDAKLESMIDQMFADMDKSDESIHSCGSCEVSFENIGEHGSDPVIKAVSSVRR